MKVILSRKGFDNQYGKQPSPILPDGTLLSLPIPMQGEQITFSDLKHNSKSYIELIRELNPKTHLTSKDTCHLDPDIRKEAQPGINNWTPLFGQAGSALGHLLNHNISAGDLFLFFGTFHATEGVNKRLQYSKNAPNQHIIYGYFQVKQLHIDAVHIRQHLAHHPHGQEKFLSKKINGIFEATEQLSFDKSQPGAGVLQYHDDLVLTKPGYSKSRWQLPEAFRKANITYHSQRSFKPHYFQSAAKGQEFIVSQSPFAEKWAQELIEKGTEAT